MQLTFQELQNVLDSPPPQIHLLFAAFIIIKGNKIQWERAMKNKYHNTPSPATLPQARLTWLSLGDLKFHFSRFKAQMSLSTPKYITSELLSPSADATVYLNVLVFVFFCYKFNCGTKF